MNFIKAFIMKRRSERSLRQLKALYATFAVLEKAEKGNLLWFDKKNRRLFIEEPFALVMMTKAKMWQNFLQNCFTWLYWRQCTEAWDSFILKEEMKAVRRMRKKETILNKRDVERIRYARRQEINMSDMEPPQVEPFEFFIIKSNSQAHPNAEDRTAVPGGEVLSVGSYNPQTGSVEMALWEDVQKFLK